MPDIEVAKDLTMIQPEPSDTDLAYQELVKRSSKGESLTPAPTTQKQATRAIEGMTAEQFSNNTMREGTVDPELDAYQMDGETTGDVRARNQSSWIKGAKAIGGGIYQGALIVAEQAGYVADIDTYTNLFKETEDLSGNWWVDLMKQAQESGRESDMFKIYDEAPEENSLMSQIFKWSSLEGAISSGVGFGVSGAAAVGLVSKLGALKQFGKMAKFTDDVMGNLAGKGMEGATKAFAGPLASSAMSNYYIGQMMATETFKETMDTLRATGKIGSGDGMISEFDAQKVANNNAQDVVSLNMVLVATAYLRFGNIFKRNNNLSAKVKDPTAMWQLKELIKKGSPTEFTEEVYNESTMMEQVHDTQRELGLTSEYADNYWDRMSNLALSTRSMQAGALGIVGGPLQFAMIQKPFMKDQYAQQRTAFTEQSAGLKWHKKVIDGKMADFKEFNDVFNRAAVSGHDKDLTLAENLGLVKEIVHSNQWGILDYLRKDVEDIRKLDPEDAMSEKHGYDSTYQETADQFLGMIDKVQDLHRRHQKYENASDLVFNRMSYGEVANTLLKAHGESKTAYDSLIANLEQNTDLKWNEIYISKKTGKLSISKPSARFDGMSPAQKTAMLEQEAKKDIELGKFVLNNPLLKEFTDSKKDVEKYKKLMAKLDDQYVAQMQPEYQKEFKDKSVKNMTEFTKKAEEDAKDDEKLDSITQKNYMTFGEVKNTAKIETPLEKETREQAWQANTEGNSIPNIKTFTSIDKQGNRREFSPDDITRSVDGRYFRVLGQSRSDTYKGNLYMQSVPTMVEVTHNGSKWVWGKGAKKFELEDISFLRPEVLQNLMMVKGDPIYGKTWGEYLKTDSILRPNLISNIESMAERADLNEVITVGLAEFETMNPKPGEQLVPTELSKTHNLHKLNQPFTAPYPVEFKLRREGPGKEYIDVYEKGESKPLTRLDRNANINYNAILSALTKGPVYGEVTTHYSNKKNLVHIKNEDGSKHYVTIGEVESQGKKSLPNGKVYLVSTNGKYSENTRNVIVGSDDSVSLDGTLEVEMPDGTLVTKTVNFSKLEEGDTYFLAMSSSGELVPIAMATVPIGQLQSDKQGTNTTFADDLRDMHQETINAYFNDPAVFADREAWEAAQNPYIDATADQAVIKNRSEKRAELKEHKLLVIEKLKETVYQHINPRWGYMNYKTADGYVSELIKGKKVFREDFFQLGFDVSKSGKIVPTVDIRDPQNPTVTKSYSMEDNPAEYMFHLNKRFSRLPLSDMMNKPGFVQSVIDKGELKTDINPTQMFAGSTATITVIGDDIQTEGKAAASVFRGKYKSKFKVTEQKITEGTKTAFLEGMRESLDALMVHLVKSEDVDDIVLSAKNNLIGLDVVNTKQIITLVDEIFSDQGLLDNEAEISASEMTIKEAYPDMRDDVAQAIATYIVAYDKVTENISNGTFVLKLANLKNLADNADLFNAQKEDTQFFKGGTVYHKDLGLVIVHKPLHNGYYFVTNSTKTITPVKVWAKDMYIADGEFHKLFKAKKELASAMKSKNPALIEVKERAVQTWQNKLARKGLIAEPVSAKDLQKDEASEEDSTIIGDVDLEGVTQDWSHGSDYSGFTSTSRVKKIYQSVIDLKNTETAYSDATLRGDNTEYMLTDKDITEINTGILQAIPYTVGELNVLMNEAQEQGDNTALAALSTLKSFMENLLNFRAGQNPVQFNSSKFLRGDMKTVQHMMMSKATPAIDRKLTSEVAPLYSYFSNAKQAIGRVITAESTLRKENFYSKSVVPKATPVPVAALPTVAKKDSEAAKKPVQVKNTTAPVKLGKTPEVETELSTDAEADIKSHIEGIVGMDDITKGRMSSLYLSMLDSMDADAVLASLREAHPISKQTGKQIFSRRMEELEDDDVPFKRGTGVTLSQDAFDYEVREAKKMLPLVPLEVVENVAHMVNKFGAHAIGAYNKGVMYLVNRANTGTAYHEVFHAVADLHLRPFEKQMIAEENGYKTWNATLEENLADKFADYSKAHRAGKVSLSGLKAFTQKFFKSLMDWAKGTRSMDATMAVFKKTVTGGYATSQSLQYLGANEMHATNLDNIKRFKNSLSAKENVTLQELLTSNKIKIDC